MKERKVYMRELGMVLLAAIFAMGVLLIILLQKISLLKKQTDDIVKEIQAYVNFVITDGETASGSKKFDEKSPSGRKIFANAEAESSLINAVLEDYF